MTKTLNVNSTGNDIIVREQDDRIILRAANTVVGFVNADTPFYLNGNGGNTYLKYNSTTARLELWVNGNKKEEWS